MAGWLHRVPGPITVECARENIVMAMRKGRYGEAITPFLEAFAAGREAGKPLFNRIQLVVSALQNGVRFSRVQKKSSPIP